MSGRVAAVDGVESNPDIVYVGAAAGGVWKSVNGGLTWTPVFDDQPVASIGAIAVFQANPDVVWVGTGEGNPRNSVSVGNGVYRSLDGGQTWSHLGLEKTEHIHRIVLHPTDPDVAWVAALGQAWGENPERGVFKTEDGGKTWSKVLYVDARTGAADLVDRSAQSQQAVRRDVGVPALALVLPLRRPGLRALRHLRRRRDLEAATPRTTACPRGTSGGSASPSRAPIPNIVYALVEAEKSALLRSDDGGRTWKTVNDEPRRRPSGPFYYADIRVDPAVAEPALQPDRPPPGLGRQRQDLRRPRPLARRSTATTTPCGSIRAIPSTWSSATTAASAISHDRGETWQFVANLPLGQFYHVAVDMDAPYNVYGGLQDNGSWRGPSTVWEHGRHPQPRLGRGRRRRRLRHPARSRGLDDRLLDVAGRLPAALEPAHRREPRRSSRPQPARRDDAPLQLERRPRPPTPSSPGTIYYGSQFLHKSTDRGDDLDGRSAPT